MLSACSNPTPEPPPVTSTSTASATSSASAPRSDGHVTSEKDQRLAADSKGARDAAGQIMRAIAATDTHAKSWGRSLEQMFTDTGKQQLGLLDRQDLTFTAVTGTPRLLAIDAPSMRHWPIIVATNRGTWVITMTQEGSSWRAEAISAWEH